MKQRFHVIAPLKKKFKQTNDLYCHSIYENALTRGVDTFIKLESEKFYLFHRRGGSRIFEKKKATRLHTL